MFNASIWYNQVSLEEFSCFESCMIHGVQLETLQSQKLHDPNRVKVCLEQCLLVPARLVYPVYQSSAYLYQPV